jgi:putative FmdB family regulatory protein
MPFYEYECTNCKFYVEALQKVSEAPLKQCPSCKKQTLKKLVSAPVFRLKGGGWYETDFKSDQEGKRNLAGAEEAAEAKPADDAKGEKPAAAAEGADKSSDKSPDNSVAKKPAAAATSKPAAKKKAHARSVSRPAKTHSKAKAKAAKRPGKRRR